MNVWPLPVGDATGRLRVGPCALNTSTFVWKLPCQALRNQRCFETMTSPQPESGLPPGEPESRFSESKIFGSGVMAELVRTFDWASTSLGPLANWPEALRCSVNLMLATRFPCTFYWGADMIQFYNDAYRPLMGEETPDRAWPAGGGVLARSLGHHRTSTASGSLAWRDDLPGKCRRTRRSSWTAAAYLLDLQLQPYLPAQRRGRGDLCDLPRYDRTSSGRKKAARKRGAGCPHPAKHRRCSDRDRYRDNASCA